MKMSVPTSWDNSLLEKLAKINQSPLTYVSIYEVYGALQSSIIGSGRASSLIPFISRRDAEKHIKLAHKYGFQFNFLLNAMCMGGKEFIPQYHYELLELLKWINDIGVDTITVTIPYIMEIVKCQFPNLKICVSVTALVGTVQKAKFFSDDIGVNRINISFMSNRNFPMLKAMRKSVKPECQLEVLANDPCLFHCPYREYHQSLFGHSSQASPDNPPFNVIDYPGLKCAIKRIQSKGEILKSTFIRPEDSIYWEDIGIDFLKIAGRTKTSDWIYNCAQIYSRRDFDGNIYNFVEKSGFYSPEYNRFLNSFDQISPLRLYIDNKSLDGFIEYFVNKNPHCDLGCETIGCNHCYTWAEKVIKIDDHRIQQHYLKLQKILSNLTNSLFIKEKLKMD